MSGRKGMQQGPGGKVKVKNRGGGEGQGFRFPSTCMEDCSTGTFHHSNLQPHLESPLKMLALIPPPPSPAKSNRWWPWAWVYCQAVAPPVVVAETQQKEKNQPELTVEVWGQFPVLGAHPTDEEGFCRAGGTSGLPVHCFGSSSISRCSGVIACDRAQCVSLDDCALVLPDFDSTLTVIL